MATGIVFDTKDFDRRIKQLEVNFKGASKEAVNTIADEVLRLSQREVPHDTGFLQNTGNVERANSDNNPEAIVGYHTPYAARLHEHPEYNFQGGRKGKYLEDPIKHNLRVFTQLAGREIGGVLR
jgi:hypothetical protein